MLRAETQVDINFHLKSEKENTVPQIQTVFGVCTLGTAFSIHSKLLLQGKNFPKST